MCISGPSGGIPDMEFSLFLFMNIIDNINIRVSAVRWDEGLPERVLGDGGVDNDRRFGYGMDELHAA